MAIVRISQRGYKAIRNAGLLFLGAVIVLLTVIAPRVFGGGGGERVLGNSDVARADAPGSCSSCSSCTSDGCSDGGCGGCAGDAGDAGDAGAGDCCDGCAGGSGGSGGK
ncbi:MAG: hypothetical protein G01um10148_720 [Parcubacteria group bacterium Gr01-1014_8]|nr:MAG: hypothetical protein G01um10148_720 [Parcubacteria group bacterium Gr01-1014_8]